MAIHPWPHLINRLKKGAPLWGLDVGSKTIGVALSDPELQQASPIETILRTNPAQDYAALAKLALERGSHAFVIGLPLNMDGSTGDAVKKIQAFALGLIRQHKLFAAEPEISFYDERLSTAAMQRFLIDDADLSRAKRAAVIDKLAATHILQAALDHLRLAPAR